MRQDEAKLFLGKEVRVITKSSKYLFTGNLKKVTKTAVHLIRFGDKKATIELSEVVAIEDHDGRNQE